MNLRSLRTRLGLIFLAFAALVSVSVSITYWGLEAQKADALVINLAGRQRMLVQQMTREALEIARGQGDLDVQALDESAQTFERTLAALAGGGPAPYLPGQIVRIPATRDPLIREQIAGVEQAWQGFALSLTRLEESSPGRPEFAAGLQEIERQSPALVSQADAVVRAFEAAARQKVVRLRWVQLAFFASALLLVGVGSWVTRSSVVQPLEVLGKAAQRIGAGELEQAIQAGGSAEIDRLAVAMEEMRGQIKATQAELFQWADRLEQRVAQRTSELEALNAVSREITSHLDIQEVLNRVVEKTQQLLSAEAVYLCLLDESGQSMRLKAMYGVQGAVAAPSTPAWEDNIHQVLTQNDDARLSGSPKPEGVAKVHCTPGNCAGCCKIIAPPFRKTQFAAPLRTGEKTIGALCVAFQAERFFTEDEKMRLAHLANIAAIALENARLYIQAERLAGMEERQRIAAEMHDGLAQTLSYAQILLGQAGVQAQDEQAQTTGQAIQKISAVIDQAIGDTRLAISSLKDGRALRSSLQEQLQNLAAELQAPYPRLEWLDSLPGTLYLPPQESEQVLRVGREALWNALRHSQAGRVTLHLCQEGTEYTLAIEDDGLGFDSALPPADGGQHFGLKIMQARAARLGGRLEIHSSPGQGACIKLAWPAHPPEHSKAWQAILIQEKER